LPKRTNNEYGVVNVSCTSAKEISAARPKNVSVLKDDERSIIDDDPITPEEEADLLISMDEFKKGKVTVVPGSCSDEELFKILRGEQSDGQ